MQIILVVFCFIKKYKEQELINNQSVYAESYAGQGEKNMKRNILVIITVILVFFIQTNVFTAGINLMTDSLVANVVFFKTKTQRDNNERSGLPYYPYLNPGEQKNIDAVFDGFYAMRWENNGGVKKEAILDIAGITGWRNVKILSDDRVQIGAWGLEQPRTVNSSNY